ncbi:MAG TPA: class I SAM-dependent methyltransferase [Gallionella sp.]|nr:class I SAM-dependent methyltransferase [Gallionella sp.]
MKKIDGLDADFAEALSKRGLRHGRLLEIGAGLGDQAVHYARMGFEVTATEVSGTAIVQASALASRLGVRVSFVNDNILFSRLEGVFDVIADRGCYTVLPRDFLEDYARNTARLLATEGYMLLKTDRKSEDKLAVLQRHFEVLDCFYSHYRKGYQKADESLSENAVFTVLRHRAGRCATG